MKPLRPRDDNVRHYKFVADYYRAAVANGIHNPAQRLAKEFEVPVGRVHGWARRARTMGLLDPTHHGRISLRNPKIERLSARLGVTYDELLIAINEECAGDVRVSNQPMKGNP